MSVRRLLTFVLAVVPLCSAVAGDGFRDCPQCPEMVRLPGLSMARTETTRGQWLACVKAGFCRDKLVRWPGDGMPMTEVTVRDAETYAAWLSKVTGRRYRLPTEAEWEAAARAGTATAYPWGEAMEPGRAVCRSCDPRFDRHPAPAASMAPNPWGLFDMNGNVWELTADCWAPGCRQRVVKGGSWYFVPAQSRSESRAPQDAGTGGYDVGFRVARED
jgi:Uncharacterized conserved protein